MRYTQCIFYWFWNVAVRRLLLHFSYFVKRSGRCLLYEFQSGKMFWRQGFWLHLVHLFFSKNPPKPNQSGNPADFVDICLTNSQQRVDSVSHVMIYFLWTSLCPQSGNRVDHYSWLSLWKYELIHFNSRFKMTFCFDVSVWNWFLPFPNHQVCVVLT